ncbi:MAG: hypothetical protein ACLUHG_02600 [Sutterella wadsworthensis]
MNFMTLSVTSTPFDLMMPKPLSSGSTVTRARHSSFTRQASAFESTILHEVVHGDDVGRVS